MPTYDSLELLLKKLDNLKEQWSPKIIITATRHSCNHIEDTKIHK